MKDVVAKVDLIFKIATEVYPVIDMGVVSQWLGLNLYLQTTLIGYFV